MDTPKIKIGITHGDINGIGYELIIKTLQDKRINDLCLPIVYGSPKLTAYHRKTLNIENFNLNIISKADEAHPKRPNVINCIEENIRIELGKSTQDGGKAAIQSIEAATRDMLEGSIDAVLTAPINKNSIQNAGFEFPGHTEYFQNKAKSEDSLMFMLGENMKIGVVTGHIPLKDVAQTITQDLILSKLRIMQTSLLQDFAIRKPKIAVLGLNPHAGDDGVLGKEEQEVIIPALEKARSEGIMSLGPYAADGFFGAQMFLKFDAVLAMYHDQGLAPFKAVEFESGVNFTAGLPIVRTSPNHGTAFEIAGKGIASENSFRKALFRAVEIVKNRKQYEEISKNPL
ncbi:MAG: 4-hydroxythreonine-4-phosphate dehydrogenase PdxA [Bacteroidia bacterium]|nr:MAG: 4-hydroxythreonine-4-phosphate dehydrogenase PdxA [Bacteroidia bacterium]